MCGLFGAFRVSKSSWDEKRIQSFMYQGLLVSTMRGTAGTGVGLIERDWTRSVEKSHHAAWDFMELAQYGWARTRFGSSLAILGHTRAATVNNSYNRNGAHPHAYYSLENKDREVILTHNGHVHNAYSLTPSNFNHPVDSAHVSYAICVNGAEKILPRLDGAYVLVWYESDSKTMHIAKNQSLGRDLCIAFSKDKKIMYYASEQEFLRLAISRSGVDHDGKYQDVSPFVHFSWDLTKEDLSSPKHEKYEETRSYNHGGHHHFFDGGRDPKKNSVIWAAIPAYLGGKENTLIKYEHGRGNMQDCGRVYAEPFLDTGALIKIGGVSEQDWADICKYTRGRVPVKVLTTKKPGDFPDDVKAIKPSATLFIRGILDEIEFTRLIEDRKKYSSESRLPAQVNHKKLPDLPADSGELVDGPADKKITKQEWREAAKGGCFICDEFKIVPDSHMNQVRWFPYPRNKEDSENTREFSMICAKCADDERLMQDVLGA